MKYLIVKGNDSTVTSRNSRELKRKIKSSKPMYKKYTVGNYYFMNKESKICFVIKYDIVMDNRDKPRIKGTEVKV